MEKARRVIAAKPNGLTDGKTISAKALVINFICDDERLCYFYNWFMSSHERHLIYFADPMCSWCWGFSPVIEKIVEVFGAQLPIRLVMGGLRAGNRTVMGQSMKADIRAHWQHVEEATKQAFNFDFFKRNDFVYDTAPACRAVVAVRRFSGGGELLFLSALHRAFYLDNRDLTDESELTAIVSENGLGADRFEAEFNSEASGKALERDFNNVLENGIRAFPALIGGSEADGYMSVTHGWRPFEELKPSLDRLVSVEQLPKGFMPGLSGRGCTLESGS